MSCDRFCTPRSTGCPIDTGIPVILSYLEGKTNEEVAELLQWPVGTVKGRLSRARDLLRSRLLRRGLSLVSGFPGDSPVSRNGLRRGRSGGTVPTDRASGQHVPVASGLAIAGFVDDPNLRSNPTSRERADSSADGP